MEGAELRPEVARDLEGARLVPGGQTLPFSRRTASSCGSSFGSSVTATLPLLQEMSQERVGVWVDASHDGLPILKTTVGFTMLSGPLPDGFELSQMLPGAQHFVRWLRQALNSAAEPAKRHVCKIRMLPVGAASHYMEFRVTCEVVLHESAIATQALREGDDSGKPALLVLYDIEQHSPRRRKGTTRQHKRGAQMTQAAVHAKSGGTVAL